MSNNREATTAQDFLKQINDPPAKSIAYGAGTASNLHIIEKVEITRESYKQSKILFQNCCFDKELVVLNHEFDGGVIFQDCVFIGSVLFTDLTCTKNPNLDRDIIFERCTFHKSLVIGDKTDFCRGVYIAESEIKGRFRFVRNRIREGGLRVFKTIIQDIHDFASNQINSSIAFDHSTVYDHVRLDANNFSSLHITNSVLKKSFWVAGGRSMTGISIEQSEFDEKLSIDRVQFFGVYGLTIVGNNFKRGVLLKYIESVNDPNKNSIGPCSLYITDNDFGNKFECIAGFDSDLSKGGVSHEQVKSLEIKFSNNQKGEIEFTNLNIETLQLSGVNNTCAVSFFNAGIRHLQVKNLINKATINFVRVYPVNFRFAKTNQSQESSFSLENSYLGDFRFTNTILDRFKIFTISDSDISQITISPFNWFSKEKTNLAVNNGVEIKKSYFLHSPLKLLFWYANKSVTEEEQPYLEYTQKRKDLYRQLKIVAERIGERAKVIEFKSQEMKLLNREHRLSPPLFSKERFLLLVSSINDFGVNWWRPLWLIALITFLIYIPIVVSASPLIELKFTTDVASIKHSWQIICERSDVYWELLNPTHSIKKVFNDSIDSNWTYVFDYLQRIIFAVLVFQAITAFRKYGK